MTTDIDDPNKIKFIKRIEGSYIVDAGPGTGKTFSLVHRYKNIIEKGDKDGVDPRNILLLTFTKNGAAEMEERIKKELRSSKSKNNNIDFKKYVKYVKAKTFDSFFGNITSNAPIVENDFDIDTSLLKSAKIVGEDEYNIDILKRIISEKMAGYGAIPYVARDHVSDVMIVISKMMSKGMIPLRDDKWFSPTGKIDLKFNNRYIKSFEKYAMTNNKFNDFAKKIREKSDIDIKSILGITGNYGNPDNREKTLNWITKELLKINNNTLIHYIHDVYSEYIKRCIQYGTLSYALNALLAFVLLYSSEEVRKYNSYDYVMIDEFQDTNNLQLASALMIIRRNKKGNGNICAIGDWKQSIYGFRFASANTIIDYDKNVRKMANTLGERVQFKIQKAKKIPFDENRRSSQKIIDASFKSMYLKGSKNDLFTIENIVKLKQFKGNNFGNDTFVRILENEDKHRELDNVVNAINEFIYSKKTKNESKYPIHLKNGMIRNPRFGDVAILCRTTNQCRRIFNKLVEEEIPCFIQGNVDVLRTDNGKILLACLKLSQNKEDRWGIVTLMNNEGYSQNEIAFVFSSKDYSKTMPQKIMNLYKKLHKNWRDITKVAAVAMEHYKLYDDESQAIYKTISERQDNSGWSASRIIQSLDDDFDSKTKYSIDPATNESAVKIMTMHSSKGMEFSHVIIPFVNGSSIPLNDNAGRSPVIEYRDDFGLCCNMMLNQNKTELIKDWKIPVLKMSVKHDYSEERRILFVAMSRARQYLTLTYNNKNPSQFMKDLLETDIECDKTLTDFIIPDTNKDVIVGEEAKVIDTTYNRRIKLTPHDLMSYKSDKSKRERSELMECFGKEYGTSIHSMAERLFYNVKSSDDATDSREYRNIMKILKHGEGAEKMSEVECRLVVDTDKGEVVISGVIDLIYIFPDRVEIHDYKTDHYKSDSNHAEYVTQLSIYALAAKEQYKRPVKCYIDYISLDDDIKLIPIEKLLTMKEIREKICDRL